MHLLIRNRSLLRGMVAGAVALAGASACSRSDRAAAGRDTTQTGVVVVPADTQAGATSNAPVGDTASNTATTQNQPPKSRIHPDSSIQKRDKAVAGYRGMDRDTSMPSGNGATDSAGHIRPKPDSGRGAAPSGAAEPGQASSAISPPSDTAASASVSDSMPAEHAMADTSVSHEVRSDTANADYAPMARDTSMTLAQGDTTVRAQVDTSSEVAVGIEADTAAVANDSAADRPVERVHEDTVSRKADELAKHEPARVRPPEDSAETRGHVTTDRAAANGDAAAVGAAGVASTGNIATGAAAVDLMSRGGERCTVVAPEESRDVLWDMASSPASLNPCGTGTMTLPRTWTGEKK